MTQQPAHQTKQLAADPDGQLLLHLNKAIEIGPIPEPNRNACIELLRMMLWSAVDATPRTEEGAK